MAKKKEDKIEKGDTVNVYWNDRCLENAIVLHLPTRSGDLWYFKSNQGVVRAINPYYSNFNQIALIKKKEA